MRETVMKVLLILVVCVLLAEIYYGVHLHDKGLSTTPLRNQNISYETTTEPEVASETTDSVESKLEKSGLSVNSDIPEFVVVRHRATEDNIYGNSTYLDESSANGNPKAVVIVTQNWNPTKRSGVYNDHEIGVWYNYSIERWGVYNQDLAPIPEGASFNVVISEK